MKPNFGARPKNYSAHESDRMQELNGSELASFARRAIALYLDFIFAALLMLAIFISLAVFQANRKPGGQATSFHYHALSVSELFHHSEEHAPEPQPGSVNLKINFFGNWYSVLYLTLFLGLSNYFGNGRTLGKRIVGIRVVSLVQRRLSLWHSFERALGYGASTLELGFGFFQYFIHPNRRTVHDRIAETIVVRERPIAVLPQAESTVGISPPE
jgi:uncharacterized RDD family membrane protein YckC